MSDTDDLRYRISALEHDLAKYQDALEQHLYDVELNRVERSHGWVNTIGFVGSVWAAIWLAGWLTVDNWIIETVVTMVAFPIFFMVFFWVTEKPLKREIDKIRKPLSWLPKPRWRENNHY